MDRDVPLTRRELARRGAGSAILLGLAGRSLLEPGRASADAPSTTATGQGVPAPSDSQLLGTLIGVDLLAEFVYRRASASGQLAPRLHRLAAQLAVHEHVHATALGAELVRLGDSAPGGPDGDGDAEAALSQHHIDVQLAELHTDHQWLDLMLSLEGALERNYHTAIGQLRRPRLLHLAAEILASEAQHSAVLGGLLHPGEIDKSVPNAFVNGNNPAQ
jgi:Ferritin-like domain